MTLSFPLHSVQTGFYPALASLVRDASVFLFPLTFNLFTFYFLLFTSPPPLSHQNHHIPLLMPPIHMTVRSDDLCKRISAVNDGFQHA